MITMETINTFDTTVRQNNRLPYICNDIFYDVICKLLRREFCKSCNVWNSHHRISVCYFPDSSMCFYCRHRRKWPHDM